MVPTTTCAAAKLICGRSSPIARRATTIFISASRGPRTLRSGASSAGPEARRPADSIRAGIAERARDGELSSFYFPWFLDPNNDSVAVFSVESARQEKIYLIEIIAALAAFLIVLVTL